MKYFLLTAFFLTNVSLLSQARATEDDQVGASSPSIRHTVKGKTQGDAFIAMLQSLVAKQSNPGASALVSFSPSTGVLVVTRDESLRGFKFLPVIPEDEEEVAPTDK